MGTSVSAIACAFLDNFPLGLVRDLKQFPLPSSGRAATLLTSVVSHAEPKWLWKLLMPLLLPLLMLLLWLWLWF